MIMIFRFIALVVLATPAGLLGQTATIKVRGERIEVRLKYESATILDWDTNSPRYEIQVHSEGRTYRYLNRGLTLRNFGHQEQGIVLYPRKDYRHVTKSSEFFEMGFVEKFNSSKRSAVFVRNGTSGQPLHAWLRKTASDNKIRAKVLFADGKKEIERSATVRFQASDTGS